MKPMFASALLLLLLFDIAPVCAQSNSEGQGQNRMDQYWPLNTPQRGWRLVEHGDPSRHRMTVTHTNVDETTFRMWFFDKPGQADGHFNIEQFRYHENRGGLPWLWLDKYINFNEHTNQWSEHPVYSTRILLTPSCSKTQDLIADGTYERCGGRGQPYLLFDPPFQNYRLQVWGTIGEQEQSSSKYRWYWDATVSAAEEIRSDSADFPKTVSAVKVKEAWWDNFGGDGEWTAPGKGSLDGNGLPTGDSVEPFRTVWHAKGKIPYFLIGKPDESPSWCTSQLWDVSASNAF